MIKVRKSDERGHFNFGWLDTHHTFSFGEYYDEENMGFRSLRVINDDTVAGGKGFPTHGHRDMEIVTYVLKGALEHKDSMGNGSVMKHGDVQRMSAGTGVRHSEFNPSQEELRLLQIWILPAKEGEKPGYEQKFFKPDEKANKFLLVASPDGREGSVTVRQDAFIFASILEAKKEMSFSLKSGRGSWIQIASGEISVNGLTLKEGDGAAVENETELKFLGLKDSEFLLFELGK